MKMIRVDNEIIYVWASNKAFIYNNQKYPFLQNIIAHAIPGRNIHIVIHQLSDLDQLDKSIEELTSNLWSANIKNIHIYKFSGLFSDQAERVELVSNLLESSKSLANPIDLIKLMLGANLERLNLEQALLADMDCIVPENIQLDSDARSLSVIPLLDKNTPFMKSYLGTVDCYLENGFSMVFGQKNTLLNEILNMLFSHYSDKGIGYFQKRPNDRVYNFYVKSLIRYFINSQEKGKELRKKYQTFSRLPGSVKAKLATPLQTIDYDRGGSWGDTRVMESMPLVFKAGHQPIYPKELASLESYICSSALDKVLPLLRVLVEKGWDPNEKLIWINSLQRTDNILYCLLERNIENEDNLVGMSDVMDLLMKNGLSLDGKLLSFFMQTYRAESSREAFKVYAKVFADYYGLDYERMLSDVDRMPEPSNSYFPKINENWFYSQVESKGVDVSIPAKPKKVDVSIKLAAAFRVSYAFFKSMHVSLSRLQKEQDHAESKAHSPSKCG